jgi:hypothetical protein
MRLWSLHPRYLDAVGLVACWRESLLAQKVLTGTTRGYRRHPQLERFRSDPAAIGTYLHLLADEADARSYHFDRSRILEAPTTPPVLLPITSGQLEYERQRLAAKYTLRSPQLVESLLAEPSILPHPLFRVVDGAVEPWERVTTGSTSAEHEEHP